MSERTLGSNPRIDQLTLYPFFFHFYNGLLTCLHWLHWSFGLSHNKILVALTSRELLFSSSSTRGNL